MHNRRHNNCFVSVEIQLPGKPHTLISCLYSSYFIRRRSLYIQYAFAECIVDPIFDSINEHRDIDSGSTTVVTR